MSTALVLMPELPQSQGAMGIPSFLGSAWSLALVASGSSGTAGCPLSQKSDQQQRYHRKLECVTFVREEEEAV